MMGPVRHAPAAAAAAPADRRAPGEPAAGELSFDFEPEVEAKDALRRACLEASGYGSGHGRGKRVCRFWLKGLCMKQDKCPYLHVWDSSRMPECTQWQRHGKCTDPDCVLRHVDPSERPLCGSYQLGFCPRGRMCRDRHDRLPPDELPELLSDSFIDSLLLNPHLVPRTSQAMLAELSGVRRRAGREGACSGGPAGAAAAEQGAVPGLPCPIHGACRYFLVRATSTGSIRTSMSKGIWATSHEATPRLGLAFQDVDHVVLIFAAAESKQFHGYGRMSCEPSDKLLSGIWAQESGHHRIGANFRVHWIKRCMTDYSKTDHIKIPRDDDFPVRRCRNGQELPLEVGQRLCRLLWEQPHGEPPEGGDLGPEAPPLPHPARAGSRAPGPPAGVAVLPPRGPADAAAPTAAGAEAVVPRSVVYASQHGAFIYKLTAADTAGPPPPPPPPPWGSWRGGGAVAADRELLRHRSRTRRRGGRRLRGGTPPTPRAAPSRRNHCARAVAAAAAPPPPPAWGVDAAARAPGGGRRRG